MGTLSLCYNFTYNSFFFVCSLAIVSIHLHYYCLGCVWAFLLCFPPQSLNHPRSSTKNFIKYPVHLCLAVIGAKQLFPIAVPVEYCINLHTRIDTLYEIQITVNMASYYGEPGCKKSNRAVKKMAR